MNGNPLERFALETFPTGEAIAALTAGAVAVAAAILIGGSLLWVRATWRAYRPARHLLARLERLAGELEQAPGDIAPLTPADRRGDMEDRLLLLEAQGQGDSPRARALRRRLGMVG